MKRAQQSTSAWSDYITQLRRRPRRLGVLSIITLIVVGQIAFGLASMYYGVQLVSEGRARSYGEVVSQLAGMVRSPSTVVRNFVRGRLAQPERLVVDIGFAEWQRLADTYREAWRVGSLHDVKNPTVPASIRHNGTAADVTVRMKGGPSQFRGGKWPLRVHVMDEDKTIRGLKSFSLHHPEARGYLDEWILHKMMQREQVAALQYDFVSLTVNGKEQGIYALEEHFGTEVIERNERRVGPIVTFSEGLYEDNGWAKSWPNEVREVNVHQTQAVLQNQDATNQWLLARSLIEQFRQGEARTCDVFDCAVLARYFAVLDLLGASHAAESGNMKMYYNPVTAHLEPIPFNGRSDYVNAPLLLRTWSNYKAEDSARWIRDIFSDDTFLEQYIRELTRLAEPTYLETFFSDIDSELRPALDSIYASYPSYSYSPVALYERQDRIRQVLDAKRGLDIYLEEFTPSAVTLSAGTILSVPVDVRGLKCRGESVLLDEPIRLRPLVSDGLIDFQTITLPLPSEDRDKPCRSDKLKISYSLLGQDTLQTDVPHLLPRVAGMETSAVGARQPANHTEFPFVLTDEQAKTISVKPGQWTVSQTLVIPGGYTFLMGPETELDLTQGAHIISHAPVRVTGSETDPVRIVSRNRDGGGVLILNTQERSYVSWAHFVGLSAPQTDSWTMTGATTFYEAPVDLRNVLFADNRDSDDALNIVRSEFSLRDATFVNVAFDGFDGDFVSGTVADTTIMRAGNDGLDFAGSTVSLERIVITQAGDKGVSIGERSSVTGEHLSVSDSLIGLVSKDFSTAALKDVQLEQLDVGIALYQKKPEFGYGQMSVKDVTLSAVAEPYAVERGSILSVDGVTQRTAPGKIADRF